MPVKSATVVTMQAALKRGLDLLAASLGLIVLSPLLLSIAILVRWRLGTPVLFRQRRPGYLESEFELVKFRTMTNATGPDGGLLGDGERLTRLGVFLRNTSIDELPELWNVMRGEMSLVGPRPLLRAYLPRYSARQARRHQVRPGLTGWAQVSGRNALDWERKLELDVWYVDNWSLWLDFRILAMTIRDLFRASGINHPGEATMSEFGVAQPEDK